MPKIWMCERSALKEYLETLAIVGNRETAIDGSLSERYAVYMSRSISTRVGRTAIIRVSGILSESGPSIWDYFCGIGGTSYRKIREEIGAADIDDAVDDKLIIFDTPGGNVDGADETWHAIKNSVKPTHGLIAGMCASGGYYLLSACETAIAQSPASWIGSIGVVVTDVDDTKYFEKWGIYIVEVTSDNAKNKRLSPLTKEGKEELRRTVNAYERQFHKRIQEGRGVSREKIIKDFGQGSMFVALDPDQKERDALSRGMIDGVKNGFETNQGQQKTGAREKEKEKMLEEFLKENPGAMAEFEKLIQAAKQEALDGERKKNAQAAKLVSGNTYGETVTKLFHKVVSGDSSIESLETVVSTIDAVNEQNKINEAVDEQEEVGAVSSGEKKPRVDTAKDDDGVDIKTEEDIEKAAAALH